MRCIDSTNSRDHISSRRGKEKLLFSSLLAAFLSKLFIGCRRAEKYKFDDGATRC